MKKITRIYPDGKREEYTSLASCAKAMGVSLQAISFAIANNQRVKGCDLECEASTAKRRARLTKRQQQLLDLRKIICKWYTTQFKWQIESDAFLEMFKYIERHWRGND